jgi:16S rRNA processing protein RimM
MQEHEDDLICVGNITGVYGVKGWVKVYSDTSPRENIVNYGPWRLATGDEMRIISVSGRLQGKNVVARLEGIDQRDQAIDLVGSKIYILPEQLPQLNDGDYYWSDLIGLEVESLDAEPLGTVETMMETGANDVMVLHGDRERLIPFVIDDVVRLVDLANKRVVVDWKPDY